MESTETTQDRWQPVDTHALPYDARRRSLIQRLTTVPTWVKVIDALLVVLVLGDCANLFMAIETAMRSDYPVIIAVTISLTGLAVLLPFLAGKLWRRRSRGSSDATYVLVAVLLIAWVALLVSITLLRLAVDGAAAAPAAATGGSIASLAATTASGSSHPGSANALIWLLSAMLTASGMVAFASAYAGCDPVQERVKRAELQRLELCEAYEELLALQREFRCADAFYQSIVMGDKTRYEARQRQIELRAPYLKQRVRTQIAQQLQDPASTSALAQMPSWTSDESRPLFTAQGSSNEASATTRPIALAHVG
ncbi:MAG: hypothetical protein LBU48_04370 [Coriobacteriales bacterium]|jgi:hypothetical protein|nr:hypothetical protein [Coriobacteriales bacterium]